MAIVWICGSLFIGQLLCFLRVAWRGRRRGRFSAGGKGRGLIISWRGRQWRRRRGRTLGILRIISSIIGLLRLILLLIVGVGISVSVVLLLLLGVVRRLGLISLATVPINHIKPIE